jgi:hypothetical protein
MLAIEAAMHMSFAYITGNKNLINLWKIFEKDEKIFTRMLTWAAICGMIAVE